MCHLNLIVWKQSDKSKLRGVLQNNWPRLLKKCQCWDTWLALSIEHVTLDLGVVSSSPTLGIEKKMPVSKKKNVRTSVGKDVEKLEPLHIVGGECEMLKPLWKSLVTPQNIKHRITM